MKTPQIQITNIFAKTQLVPPFSLSALESKHPFDHTNTYNPKRVFHGARIFIPYNHIKFSLFRTGTVLSRAARSSNELDTGFSWLSSFLSDFNLNVSDNYDILNIAATSHLFSPSNLYELSIHLPDSFYGEEYPFNCIIFYFHNDSPSTAFLFSSGKANFTGFKSVAELEHDVFQLSSLLTQITLDHPEVLIK